jgi:hypothetical protein
METLGYRLTDARKTQEDCFILYFYNPGTKIDVRMFVPLERLQEFTSSFYGIDSVHCNRS